jgi:arsenate reductase (thioredoxin)
MRKHFQSELSQIQERITELGRRVLENIEAASQAVLEANVEQAETVLYWEHVVDFSEVKIEEECLKVIALNQPVADDLRFLVTLIRANHDLERISDQAASMAKIARRVSATGIEPYGAAWRDMSRQVYDMVESSLHALLHQDHAAARHIWQRDKHIDTLRDELTRRLRRDILAQHSDDQTRFELLEAVYRLERAADHATNIAKAVLYLVLGQIVRHRGREFRRKVSGEKTRILFVCIHNSARSQMAAAWLNRLYGDRYEAESAGLSPGELSPLAVQVMLESGIDISGNRTRDVFAVVNAGAQFDYVITVCDVVRAERCPPVLGIAEQLQWEFDDPSCFTGTAEERLEQTRHVRDAIRRRIERWIEDEDAT